MNCINEQRKYRKLASRRLMADKRISENIFRSEEGIGSEMVRQRYRSQDDSVQPALMDQLERAAWHHRFRIRARKVCPRRAGEMSLPACLLACTATAPGQAAPGQGGTCPQPQWLSSRQTSSAAGPGELPVGAGGTGRTGRRGDASVYWGSQASRQFF